MKKLVVMFMMICSACLFQNVSAQEIGNEDIDMINVKDFYAVDIVDVEPAIQEAIYNAYDNCLIKDVQKSNGNGSPIQYKVILETQEMKNLVVAFDASGHVLKVMPEDEYLAAQQK